MKIIKYPKKQEWQQSLERPSYDNNVLEATVKKIIDEVRSSGDKALKEFTLQFDKVQVDNIEITEEEITASADYIDQDLKIAIAAAKKNIESFHQEQKTNTGIVETLPGVQCWQKKIPIQSVGLYIPGGTAPLFSTILMLAVPAKLAGCRQIILCSPPDNKGQLHPAILYTAKITGIHRVFKTGGAQAIAAMAYGTESIPKTQKIFGPGNQYVTLAKQLVQRDGVSIDLPAGPSELAVYADATAVPSFVAADLLSQAEHGNDSQVILVTDHLLLVDEVIKELDKQLIDLPRKDMAAAALENSRIFVIKNDAEALELLNDYAPEHLILACSNADELAEQVVNAGSVFLGHYSPEAAGDYATGTNHVLPTNGYAKAFSGVTVDSFMKSISFQKLSEEGLNEISGTVELMAEAEGLIAHKNAVSIRLKK